MRSCNLTTEKDTKDGNDDRPQEVQCFTTASGAVTETTTNGTKRYRYLSDGELYSKWFECVHDAARVARLKRRPQHIVEGVGTATEQKDTWRLKKSTIQTALPESGYVRCIQDVAAAGRARLVRLNIQCDGDVNELDVSDDSDVLSTSSNYSTESSGEIISRSEQYKVQKYHSWQPQVDSSHHCAQISNRNCSWQAGDGVAAVTNENQRTISGDFFGDIVKRALERQLRLQNSRDCIRLTKLCFCKFCVTASPQQTEDSKVFPDSLAAL
jgi:hypothetical protein